MAIQTRVHGDSLPVFELDRLATLNNSNQAINTTGVAVQLQGPKLDFFKIIATNGSGAVDIAGELVTGGAVEVILRAIEQLATVHLYQVEASTGQMSVAVYPTGAWTTSTLQTAIRGLGSSVGVGPVDISVTGVSTAAFKLA